MRTKLLEFFGNWRGGDKSCRLCEGLGLYLEPFAKGSSSPELILCECVKNHCAVCESKGNSPYLVYDEELNKMLPCFCHDTRTVLKEIEQKIQESRIPPRYRYKFLNSLNLKIADNNMSLLRAIDWANELIIHYNDSEYPKKGMYLTGGTGSGKTHIACAILNELIVSYRAKCRYVKVSTDFLELLRSSYQRESEFFGLAREIEQEIYKVDVLVIDDFGVQKDTEWALSKLYDLIDYRYEQKKLTLLTSNQPLSSWKEKAEGRIYSRLYEMTMTIELECLDYRVYFSNER